MRDTIDMTMIKNLIASEDEQNVRLGLELLIATRKNGLLSIANIKFIETHMNPKFLSQYGLRATLIKHKIENLIKKTKKQK